MKKIVFLVVLLIISLVGCSQITEQKENENIKRVKVKIERVVDGDTFVVKFNKKEEKVRLLLIDTPETVHPTKPVQPFGPEASEYTKKRLTNQTVELEFDVAERDKYGRLLAYVYLNGNSYNEELLEKGLARVVVFPPNTRYVDEYKAIENKAKKKKIGIWSLEHYEDR